MDTSNPAPLLMLGGGVLMVIGSLLDWRFERMGLSTDSFGLLGVFALVFGLVIAAIAATRAFGVQVNLPSQVAGLSLDQACVILALSIFLWTFGAISGDFIDFGIHLTWIGAVAALVGGLLALRSTPSAEPARTI